MKKTYNIPLKFEQTYHTNNLESYDKIILGMHGYQQNGEFLFRKLSRTLDLEKTLLICPNAPFMVPYKKNDEYVEAYSWYFFDPNKKSFYVNYEPAAEMISKLLSEINIHNKKVDLIGYSQGGYLAPKVAELNEHVESVFGLACILRSKRFKTKANTKFVQIHGINDDIVDFNEAKSEFERLDTGNKEFIEIESDHLLNLKLLNALKESY